MEKYLRARTSEQKQERMLEIKTAADKLFKKMPYANITLTTIAENLGWSRANLYKYVTTKEEIYLDITQDCMKKYFASMLTAFPKGSHFSDKTASEIWTAQVIANEDYFRYLAILLTIIEQNVTVERLTVFKKNYYDAACQLKNHIASAINISEERADFLNYTIMHFASSYFTSCVENPLIIQAMKNINIPPIKRNPPKDIKDFILMNIAWIKR